MSSSANKEQGHSEPVLLTYLVTEGRSAHHEGFRLSFFIMGFCFFFPHFCCLQMSPPPPPTIMSVSFISIPFDLEEVFRH